MNSEKLALLRHELDLAKRIASDLGMPDGKFGESDLAWEKVRSLEHEIGMLIGRDNISSDDPILDNDYESLFDSDGEDYDMLCR